MESDDRPGVPINGLALPRPIHHIGLHVSDLRAAIETWRAVYGGGPFYVNEHVTYDESTLQPRLRGTAWREALSA